MDVYKTNDITQLLSGNTYPGRGIIIGKTADGKCACAAYFIMGRSANSRNRIFTESGGEVRTEPYDITRVQDPSLIIYTALKSYQNNLIVTNGDHTDTVYNALSCGGTFEAALNTREFEPDAPNFTPRISGLLTFENGDFTYKMSILKSADDKGSACARYFYDYPSTAGLGHFIHTYLRDGDPIPSFIGEPERIQIDSDIEYFTNSLWNALNDDNKISLYVRYVDLKTLKCENRLINKNK